MMKSREIIAIPLTPGARMARGSQDRWHATPLRVLQLRMLQTQTMTAEYPRFLDLTEEVWWRTPLSEVLVAG